MIVKVIATGEGDVPSVADTYVSTEVEVLREAIGIAHGLIVELFEFGILAHGDTISDTDGPGQRESHIAVIVGLSLSCRGTPGAVLSLLQILVQISIDVVVLFLLVIVTFLLLLL